MKKLLCDQKSTRKTERPVCIFQVPECLRAKEPEAYTPQLVALGPYRHLDIHLHEMQEYKIDSGKHFRHNLELCELSEKRTEKLTKELRNKGKEIHDSYRGVEFIPFEKLALMMIVDGLFLLALVHKYTESDEIPECSGNHLLVLSSSGEKLPKDAILRDVLMLENQIPRFVLKEILLKTDFRYDSEQYLSEKLVKFCEKISPIKVKWPNLDDQEELPEVRRHHHLLDLLYQYITFKEEDSTKTNKDPSTATQPSKVAEPKSHDDDPEAQYPKEPPPDCSPFDKLRNAISVSPFQDIGPLKIILPILDLFLKFLEFFGIKPETLLQEKKVLIPSVSKLVGTAHMTIQAAEDRGTRYVEFDKNNRILRLPVITLSRTSEVVIKNLVVYETMAKSESTNFRRYIEFMGAIVDTVEDIELLRKSNVLSHPKDMTNNDILEIFNGMTGTMRSKDATIDNQIEMINDSYNNHTTVKMKSILRKYVYSSWKFFMAFATLLVLLMMGLQTFCDVYGCANAFHTAKKA